MLWVLIRIASLDKAILMGTHNIYFYGELTKNILQLSSNTLLICSSALENLMCNNNSMKNYGTCTSETVMEVGKCSLTYIVLAVTERDV